MTEPEAQASSQQVFRFLLAAASLVIIVAGLKAAAKVVLPLLLGFFLAVLSLPLLRWLRGRRVRMRWAVALTVVADLLVLGLFAALVTSAVSQLAAVAPVYAEQLFEVSRSVLATLREGEYFPAEWLRLEPLDFGNVANFVGNLVRVGVGHAASLASTTLLVLILMACVLYEAGGIRLKLQRAFRGWELEPDRLTTMVGEIQHYLGIKTAISLLTGSLAGVWVAALGLDLALVWGFLAFGLNYIPSIGSILAAIPPVLLAWLLHGYGFASLVAAGYLVINILLGNILEPNLMGRRFGLSVLVVFVSLLFWGWVWGPVGMLLSVPLTMMLRIVLRYSAGLEWVAVLMGPVPRE